MLEPMAIQVGETIQGYELLERIGAGGFGVVYRAFQSTVGREVAVKIIQPALANDPEFIRRFDREAQLIARLEHIHIVPLYDYWRDPDGAYIVMRWLRGGGLDGALQREAFALEPASVLLDQVASGLAAAHSQDVVHRDLKPSNILLDDEGNAYLSDFGIAIDLHGANSSGEDSPSTLSSNGEPSTGSLGYMSPEQLRGQAASPKSDIYSLGVTLYEMLTGRRPFPNTNSVQQLFKHIDEPLPAIDSLDSAVSSEVNAVIQKATAKNPLERYQDALAMAAAFREAAAIDDAVGLVESLTLREHEILRLLVGGKTNRQIAQELYVELPTVKWHITNIYKKLGVRTRVQAIVRARELNLIGLPDEELASSELAQGVTVAISEPINPYKGLRAFEPADEKEFYGREAVLQRILERLYVPAPRSNGGSGRFLAIVGPIGSGKSSVIKAGLIPAIWSGKLAGSEKWFVVSLVPGVRPLDSLETSLTRIAADQASNLRSHLNRDGHGLSRAADLILPNDDSELVVIVDQFEELFTLVENDEARRLFLDLLANAAIDPRSRVRVIVSLRADYYDRPLQYPSFGRLIRAHIETLLPLTAEEMEQAIVRPAEQVGVGLESGLVATMIEDVSYQPGSLPLLQYALTELFDRREGGIMTAQAFADIGGAGGALTRRAEELYQEQDSEGREMLRQMFLRLVTVAEPMGGGATDSPTLTETRRRVLRSELTSATSDPDRLDDIIDTYSDFRLLTLDRAPTTRRPIVELAHEAILRNWDRLRAWVEESETDLHMHRQLVRATSDWIEANRDESFLLRGARLTNFGGWSAEAPIVFTEEEQAFLSTSLTAREERAAIEGTRQEERALLERRSNRRLKGLVGFMALALVIVTGLSLVAVSYARRAEDQQELAEVAQVQAEEQRQIAQGALDRAEEQQQVAEGALDRAEKQQQIAENAQGVAVARGLTTSALANLELDPELSVLLALEAAETTLAQDGTVLPEVVEILHTAIQADRTEFIIPMEGRVAFSPDGRTLAIGSSYIFELRLWDTRTGEEIIDLIQDSLPISDLDFSSDGRYLAASTVYRNIKVWDVGSGMEIGVVTGLDSQVDGIAFGPEGKHIAAIDRAGTVRIWDITPVTERSSESSAPYEITELVFLQDIPDKASDVAYSPDGKRVAVVVPGTGIFVWDVPSGEPVLEIAGVSEIESEIVFSPDGKLLASGSDRLGAGIWDAATGEQIFLLSESAAINGIAFSQDGR
ncbi:MAG: protein kinase, partial [Anaerolineales bacterium]